MTCTGLGVKSFAYGCSLVSISVKTIRGCICCFFFFPRSMMDEILKAVSDDDKARIQVLQASQKHQARSSENVSRRDKISVALFNYPDKFEAHLNLYR